MCIFMQRKVEFFKYVLDYANNVLENLIVKCVDGQWPDLFQGQLV